MFRVERHLQILEILRAFDADLLSRCRFFFGGGTRIVLELDEYRQSDDVDFLCSDGSGYSELRSRAREGYAALLPGSAENGLSFPREMRIDQYGIRFPVGLGEELIRVELIREARVDLAQGVRPSWSPVDCLSPEDCMLEKLLSNSDRWGDRQVLSRDLVDLAIMRQAWGAIPESAWRRAESAYRAAPNVDLGKAISAFVDDEPYQRRCFQGLRLENVERVFGGIELLRLDLAAPSS